MTESHADQRPLLRAGVAAVVIADLVSFHFFIGDARATALASGLALGGFGDLLSRPLVTGAMILAGVAGAVAFASRPGRLWYGIVPLGALILLSTSHAQLFGSPWRHLYYSGLCLSGWLLGLVVSRRRGAPADESFARMGTIALLGAAYFNAGISKIAFGGLDWITGLPIQAAVVAQDGLVADSVVSTYRTWVVTTPIVATLFSVLTVGFELAGPLMIGGRRIRLCVALGLLAMHLNIYVLMPILYWESMVLLLLFGLSAERGGSEVVLPSTNSVLAQNRKFALTVALLAVGAVIVISHQATRFARSRSVPIGQSASVTREAEAGPPTTDHQPLADYRPPIPTPSALRQVGPFAVGQALTETWSVDALTVTDDTIIVALAGQPGRVRFEVTCHSEHGSPFDLGQAHILYSQHTEFSALEAGGWALRRRLEEAVQGGDVCNRLAEWRRSAR